MLVAVTCCIDRGKRLRHGYDYLYVHRAYSAALSAAGATPVLVSPDGQVDEIAGACAGLLLSGGDDLPRSFRSEAVETTLGDAEDVERIAFERHILAAFVAQQKPVLGICYGMQLMNLHYGGSLLRSINDEHQGPPGVAPIDHGGSGRGTSHSTTLLGASPLLEGLPKTLLTNSCHGQAVDAVAPGFKVTARAADGVIEAIEKDELFGIEWHPESDATGAVIYKNFVGRLGG